MADKTIAKILVVLALVSGCAKKSNPENKLQDAGAAAMAPGAADDDAGSGGAAAARSGTTSDEGASGQQAASGDDSGTAKGPGIPDVPKPVKWLVVTVGMGPQDLDVVIAPEKTPWRISMKPTAAELAPIAARAKASPHAIDGHVMLAVGNSVPPEAAKALFDALKAAGFKKATMEVARRP